MFRLAVACNWITVSIRYRGCDIGNQLSVEWQRPVTILSLILRLRFAITVWMKIDKLLQAVTTQRNGRQRMQRMI
jgi:hypothetical protein